MRRRTLLALAACAVVPKEAHGAPPSDEDAYELDEVSRSVPRHGELVCPKVDLVTHRGAAIRYDGAAVVHPAFRLRLVAFEALAAEVAVSHFGRKPTKLVQLGTFNCRRIGGYPELVSEHGLGNAIDVAGFDFAPLPPSADAAGTTSPKLDRRHLGAFAVRLDRHFKLDARRSPESAFLRDLARRVIARPDLFRVVLGPSYPGHHNHFHFDCAPYRLVDVFGSADA